MIKDLTSNKEETCQISQSRAHSHTQLTSDRSIKTDFGKFSQAKSETQTRKELEKLENNPPTEDLMNTIHWLKEDNLTRESNLKWTLTFL